ncbi:MAG: hypothetical protein FWG21_02370 [Oscillospiraceae bacterium]|nr:hypothetical protein [Oscillospiraceae bacterium]
MYGYTGKLLFVNLSDNSYEVRDLKESDAREYWGGQALGAKILYEEMAANVDPLGEDSVIGFVSGPLNNSTALFGGRYTVVCKSPMSNTWNDANSGGGFGPTMKQAGYDAVFVRGISEKPVYILLDDTKVEIIDADPIWGLTTLAAEDKLREMYGDNVNAALISPAGEHVALMACVMNDGHRAAGRGGPGAVMGSKKLKAVVVRGNQKQELFDRDKVMSINKDTIGKMNGVMKEGADRMGAFGTGAGYVNSVITNDASIKNWTGYATADYPEEVAEPAGSQGIDFSKTAKYNCHTCPLGCGAFHDYPSERWDLKHSPRPEYETMGAWGSQMANGDVESIFQGNNLCNEYGFDTISAGATIAWAMECYEKGILSKEELDGIELKWGDGDAIIAMMEKMCNAEGVGMILQHGTQYAADYFKKGHECLVVANGIEEPQHDSRLIYGLMRIYQYDPTPGRHVKGGLAWGGRHMTGHSIDYRGTGYQDINGIARTEQTNASGTCMFGNGYFPVVDMVEAVTGFSYSAAERLALGLRMYIIRHAFNVREGMRRKDYVISERFYKSNPPSDGPIKDILVDKELLADNFFNAIGFDMDTVPLKAALANIGGLDFLIDDIYPPEE